jgi:RNA polymerase primary sigma factor
MSDNEKLTSRDNQNNPGPAEEEILVEASTIEEDDSADKGSASAEVDQDTSEGEIDVNSLEDEVVELEEMPIAVEMSDDPVRLYLKEIGRVELLEADQELWLAVRMEAYKNLQLHRTNRSERQSNVPVDTAVHRALYDELRESWKFVLDAAKKLGRKKPDFLLILEEARQLHETWEGLTPSYVRQWLDNGLWGTDQKWEEVARNAITVLISIYSMPREVRERLKSRLED